MEKYSVPRIVASVGHNGPEAILASMTLTETERKAIQEATTSQRNDPNWHLLRKGRLTASNFGAVLMSNNVTSLLDKVLGEQPFLEDNVFVKWGIENESNAIQAFTTKNHMEVQKSGLWLSPSGVLGASPDGLVGSSAILEVKCPYKAREYTIDEAMKTGSINYVLKENDTYSLSRNHHYWHQVQGQLHITKKQTCYFVVWTTRDCVIIPITTDDAWESNLQVLENHFKAHVLRKWAQN